MAKILINKVNSDIWFERLSAVSYYSESEFEDRLIKQSASLFTEYFVLPFKKKLIHLTETDKTTKPDLVFLKRDFTEWILVEVEKKGHNIDHVLGQIHVMSKPSFNPIEIAHYIKDQETFILDPPDTVLPYDEILKLVKGQKARTMVIVDETKIDWEKPLKNKGALLCVVQVYKNGVGEEIFRVKGQYPRLYTGNVHCKLVDYPPNSLEVINHHELFGTLEKGQEIEILYNSALTKWNVIINNRGRVFFKCVGPRFPLPVGKDYTLQIDSQKKIYYFSYN